MRRSVLLTFALLAFGCDDAASTRPPDGPLFQSGSRLRARVWRGDQASEFLGWHDRKLGIDCAFALFADGSTRCAPMESASQVAYLDAACTRPVVSTSADPSVQYVQHADAACPGERSTVTVLERGAPIAGVAVFAPDASGACVETSVAGPMFAASFVAPTVFVAATVTLDASGYLDVETLTGEDGSRQLGSIYDRTRLVACTAAREDDGERDARCLDANRGFLDLAMFTDASCSSPVAWNPWPASAACQDPTIAASSAVGDAPLGVVELGPPAQGMYTGQGKACARASSALDPHLRSVGRPLDASAFQPLFAAKHGEGRLLTPTLDGADGRTLAVDGAFWDATIGAYCRPQRFADGVHRCLPDDTLDFTAGFDGYADAACTQPVLRADAARGAPRYATATYASETKVRPVVDRFAGTTLFEWNDASECAIGPAAGRDAWVLGDEVQADDAFVRVRSIVE